MFKQICAGIMTIAAIWIGGIAIHLGVGANSQLQTAKQAYRVNQTAIQQNHKRTNSLTKSSVSKMMLSNTVNVDDAKKDATDRINNAFNTAYGSVDKDKFNDAKKSIKQQLGSQFGNKLANLINPDGSIPYGNSIQECKIGFGKYDVNSGNMPVVITVKYKATESSTTSSYDYWTAIYNAHKKTFSKAQHEAIMPATQNNQ